MPLPRRMGLRGAGVAAMAGSSPTAWSVGSAAVPDARRGAGAAIAAATGSSPTMRGAGSGSTLPITPKPRLRSLRAVSPARIGELTVPSHDRRTLCGDPSRRTLPPAGKLWAYPRALRISVTTKMIESGAVQVLHHDVTGGAS